MDYAACLARLAGPSGTRRALDRDFCAGLRLRTDSPGAAGRVVVSQHVAVFDRRTGDAVDVGGRCVRASVFAARAGCVDHCARLDGRRAVRVGRSGHQAGTSRRVLNARAPKEKSKMPEMGIYESMRTLRAVRRLRPDPIPDDVLQRVLEAATWAPTGGNRQPWRIVAVKDRAKKNLLGTWYSERWSAFSK